MVKNLSHTLAYSLIGLQELNLAFKYPIILWDCACLITDSGGNAEEVEDDEEEPNEVTCYDEFEEFTDSEEETEDEEVEEQTDKKKKKTANYGKIATAIGKMKNRGIEIVATDINKSSYTFAPDVENNLIIYGLSGITRIGDDLIQEIMDNRPFNGIEDFIEKVKVNKPQMINLIKSGAFDKLYNNDRLAAMNGYIDLIADKKQRITLQNMKMLIEFGLIPSKYEFQCKVYNFNKYLKKFKKGNYYEVDRIAFDFYSQHFDVDFLEPNNNNFVIKQLIWDKIYKSQMDIIRPFIKDHNEELLNSVNNKLRQDLWDKYCEGNISKWEMDSISCYIHEHELSKVRNITYGFVNYSQLSDEPIVSYELQSKQTGQKIPLFRIFRIIGTVLDKDKGKKTVTILTPDFTVVPVKIFGDAFTHYNKQLSERGADGKKHVTEKSWFSRGNKIIVTGIRREGTFVGKKYKNTPYHLVELITDIDDNGYIQTQKERIEE